MQPDIKGYQIILWCPNISNDKLEPVLVKILHEEFFVQVATPICYDQFANAEEIEKLGKKIQTFLESWQKTRYWEIRELHRHHRAKNFWAPWSGSSWSTLPPFKPSAKQPQSGQVLHDPQYKAKAKQVGSALSPWKEMVGPVDRSLNDFSNMFHQKEKNPENQSIT